MTEADYTPIPMPTYDDLVDGGFRNAEMIDRLQRKIERLRTALKPFARLYEMFPLAADTASVSLNEGLTPIICMGHCHKAKLALTNEQ